MIKYSFAESTINSLKKLEGVNLQVIYADRFIKEAQCLYLESSYLVLQLEKNNQVKISINWFECADTSESFYEIATSTINYSVSSSDSIYSFGNRAPIKTISILKKVFSDEYNEVEHTFGFLIEREDLKSLLVTGGESAFQNLIICDEKDYISEVLSNCQVEQL